MIYLFLYNKIIFDHNILGDRVKKTILIIIGILLMYILLGNTFSKKIVIPDESIRVRVIANSNSEYDQTIKYKVTNVVKEDISKLISSTDNINVFRNKIINSIDLFNSDINTVLSNNNYSLPFNINYGLNYFPKKEFKGITYNEGYYESLVVTLGEGKGENWWCVLFPPLCLIEAEESDDVEYTTLVSELVNKYF